MAPAGVRAHRLGAGRLRVSEDAHRPAAVEQELPPVAECGSTAASRPVHGVEHAPARQRVRPADPRRLPDRPRASAADHRRRPAHHLRAVAGLQRRSEPVPGAPMSPSPAKNSCCCSLLEVLLSLRAKGESMRSAFLRAATAARSTRSPAWSMPRPADPEGPAEELVDTGIQRLLGDLDELPHPVLGYQLLEPPSRERDARPRTPCRPTAGAQALPDLLDRAHGRLQVPLPVLPDPRLQPAAAPREERRAHRRRDGADRQHVRHQQLLRHRRQFLQRHQAHARNRRDAGPPSAPRQAAVLQDPLRHRSHRPRHDPPAGAPAAHPPIGPGGRLDGRRRPHRHARQEGPEREQDARIVPPAAAERHLPDADDDAPRLAAAGHAGRTTTACSTRCGRCARPARCTRRC